TGAWMKSIDVAERHEEHAALVEADDFGEHGFFFGQAGDATELGQPNVEASGLDDESNDPRPATETIEPRQIAAARRELGAKHRSAPYDGTRVRARCRHVRRRYDRGLRSNSHPVTHADRRPSWRRGCR